MEFQTARPKLSTGYPQEELFIGPCSLIPLDKGIMPDGSKTAKFAPTGRK
jgi:hypothetical protein